MPTQTPITSDVAYYNQNDTFPPLERTLLNGDGSAMDLSSATGATITIGHASYDHHYSPYAKIVDAAACAITDAANGVVTWTPQPGDLALAGTFHYSYQVTFPGGSQTVPAHKYEVLQVRARPGGET